MQSPDNKRLAMLTLAALGVAGIIVCVTSRLLRETVDDLLDRAPGETSDLIVEAVGMVRHDAPSVFEAIERLNPYAGEVRRRFFALAAELDAELHLTGRSGSPAAPAAAA